MIGSESGVDPNVSDRDWIAVVPRIILAMATILAGAAIWGCASNLSSQNITDQLSASELQEMGENYLASNNIGQALRYLTAAEKKAPRDPVVQYDLGLAYDARHMQDEAIRHIRKAIALKPEYPEAFNALGAIYAERGEVEKAKQAFEKAISDPFYQTPYYAYYNLGRLYERQGNLAMALNEYNHAIRSHPHYAQAHFRRGRVLEALGQKKEAWRAYGDAVRDSPYSAEALFHYGRLSALLGNNAEAVRSLKRVVELDPRSPLAEAARRYLKTLSKSGVSLP